MMPASLVWGISRAESEGWSDTTVVLLLAAAVLFGGVVVRRSVRHPHPLVPPALFRERSFTVANVASLVFGAAFAANILNNVLFLRIVREYGVIEAGLFSWTRWLPLMLVLGITIGCALPVLSAAAVAQLTPAHFALGGAVNNTFRHVGAAVGVALLVTVQSTAEGIDSFRAGWWLVVACGVLAAAIALALPRSAPVAVQPAAA